MSRLRGRVKWLLLLSIIAACEPVDGTGAEYINVCRSRYEGEYGETEFVRRVDAERMAGPFYSCSLLASNKSGVDYRARGVGTINWIWWVR